jgi:drug/metabolite transporter (DMT)-like permease
LNTATLAGTGALPPLQMTAMSFGVAACLGLIVLALRGRLAELRQKPLAWVHGVGGLFGFHALYFTALALAPAAEANLINYTWPLLIVLLAAWVLRLPLTARHLAGAALGAAGCALLLGGGARLSAAALPGYLAAAASALTWALYSVLARRFAAVPTGAVVGFCAGSAVLAALAHAAVEPTAPLDARTLLAVLAMGLGPVGGAFFLWDIGMKRGDPRLLGTLAYATPVASTLLLCAGGFAAFSATLLASAVLVAAGGLVAART